MVANDVFPLAGGVCSLHNDPLRWMQQVKIQRSGRGEKRRIIVKTRFCPECLKMTEGRETQTHQVTLEALVK